MPNEDMTMQPTEFAELRGLVADVSLSDVKLGRVLEALVLHLGHAHGLDAAAEDARLAAEARTLAREEEDARLAAEAEVLAAARAAEDALPQALEPAAALATTRAAQDAQLQADADARAKAREEEDAEVEPTPAKAEE